LVFTLRGSIQNVENAVFYAVNRVFGSNAIEPGAALLWSVFGVLELLAVAELFRLERAESPL